MEAYREEGFRWLTQGTCFELMAIAVYLLNYRVILCRASAKRILAKVPCFLLNRDYFKLALLNCFFDLTYRLGRTHRPKAISPQGQ